MSAPGSRLTALPRAEPRRCRGRAVRAASPRPSELLRCFFLAAVLMLCAAAAAGVCHAVIGDYRWHWLALHLALLGGVSQLVLGAGQFFVCAFLATDPPSRRLVGAQLAAWNLGTIMVAIGVPCEVDALTVAGAGMILVGLCLFAAGLVGMEGRSLQRARWAVRWYEASAACLGVGALVGVGLARETAWTAGSLLGAHLALNLGGWLGTAIVGTMHTYFPSLTGTQLRFPRLQGPTFASWIGGVLLLAAGAASGSAFTLDAGWACLLAAASMLSANVLASLRGRQGAMSLPARLVTLAHLFLPAGLLTALCAAVAHGADGPFQGAAHGVLAALLLAGWIGLTVSGSLIHLFTVVVRVRDLKRTPAPPHPRADRALAGIAGAAVLALALSHISGFEGLARPAAILLLATAAALGARVLTLAAQSLLIPRRGAL